MVRCSDILLVGGYGVVGHRVAAILAPLYPGRVLVAGRDERKATAVCATLGHGARPRRIDVEDRVSVEAALGDVGTVISCVAKHEPHLLNSAVAHGLAYTDIAPRLSFGSRIPAMHSEARTTGARVLLGAGLSPGISNMMARQLAASIGPLDRIEESILLGLGDVYGADSTTHILEATAQPFTIFEDGQERAAVPFGEGRSVRFPSPLGPRTAYLFPFSAVIHYPSTLGVRTSLARLALDPPWAGAAASLLVRAGARAWLRRPRLFAGHRRVIESMKRILVGKNLFSLVIEAKGAGGAARMTLVGRVQADATAAGAAEFGRSLLDGEVMEPGAWLPEQMVPNERFFERLARYGLRPVFERMDAGPSRETSS